MEKWVMARHASWRVRALAMWPKARSSTLPIGLGGSPRHLAIPSVSTRRNPKSSTPCARSRGRWRLAKWPYNTVTWTRLRAAHLAIEPTCRGCRAEGRVTAANTVDHVVPVNKGGLPFPGHDGLASYCGPCHSAKTVRGAEAGAIRTTKPRRGCNADGTPLDPSHPWHGRSLGAGASGPSLGRKTQLDRWEKE